MRIGRTVIPVALVWLAVTLLSGSGHGQQTDNMTITPQQWHEDLAFFARELPKRHANAFHYTPRERFEKEVAELDSRIDHLNADGVYVGMDRIANLVGDAHTYIAFPRDDANFPIDFGRFGGEYRVIAVGAGLEKAVGARVVKVQDMPVEQAREMLRAITPRDETPQLAETYIQGYLTQGMVLHGFGIIPERSAARYTLADDSGKEFTVEVHAVPPGTKVEWVPAYHQPPLFRQKPEEKFWYTYLPDSRTVYCNERSVRDLKGPGKELLKFVQEKDPDKLVIDLRQNGGGDYFDGLHHLIEPIRGLPGINRKGHLFVLVGVRTFSAAMSNAAQFRSLTAAMLVGGTIGEKPNSYQEPREMTLPNSHLVVRYSTKFYKFVESGENVIRPDQEILPTWEDYKAGRDPVLEWVLKYQPESGR
jgi:hypothetical protein